MKGSNKTKSPHRFPHMHAEVSCLS